MKASWQDILDGCLRRDRAAQRELYNAYFGYGMSIAVRYCNDRDQSVAVLHDAFLTVFKRFDRYDPNQPFKPWFRVIVVRAALDYLRKQRKHASIVELEDHTPISDREDTLSRIGYQELLAMVQKLSEAYRTVFNLHVIDGFKHEEIAEQLGISVGTSKSNLFKARAHLKQMVEQSLQSSPPASANLT
jgi:RNA polymerase sigma-70 factor (ECF subfamily)